jgi:alpha-beta hydrolase superfamily lysophospholipase
MLSDFDVQSASVPLRGRCATPSSHPWARLLIVHGYGEHCGRYVHFMRWLAERGVASDAIDLRGHGRSGGRRGFVRRWDEYLDDLQAFLERESSPAEGGPISEPGRVGPVGPQVRSVPSARSGRHARALFLLGHSHGGLIAAAAGERGILAQAGVEACIISSPYLATRVSVPRYKRLLAHVANPIVPWLGVPKGVKPEWLTADPSMRAEDRTDALINRVATPRWYLTMRVTQKRVMDESASFSLPLLCISGEADVVADPRATAEFYRRAGSKDKSLYIYADRAHELIREMGREKVFADIVGWMRARTGQSAIAPEERIIATEATV